MSIQATVSDTGFKRLVEILGIPTKNVISFTIRARAHEAVIVEVDSYLEPNIDGEIIKQQFRLEEIKEDADENERKDG